MSYDVDPAELAYRTLTPAETAAWIDPHFRRPPHVELMSDTVARCVERSFHTGVGGRLLIEMPPRHGKSEQLSRWAPVWLFERFPHYRVLHASYESNFSVSWGRKVRDTIKDNPHKLTVRVRRDHDAAGDWSTTEGGGMKCAGVGGPFTGRGANLLLIDDPIKNRKEANSKIVRDGIFDWFTSTAFTRLEPGATIIVIMTRWHEDDLIGRLVEEQGDVWDRLNFPAVADGEDALGRVKGQALWPWRYNEDRLKEIRRTVGEFDWASLYQQSPAPQGGSQFQRKYFRYCWRESDWWVLRDHDGAEKKVPLSRCWYFQVADTAQKVGQENDWTVVTTFAVTPDNDFLVIEVVRDKLPVPDQMGFLQAQRDRWATVPNYRFMAVEDKGSGIGLVQTGKQWGESFMPVSSVLDKVTRAAPAAVAYANGAVYHLRTGEWLVPFEKELVTFPNAEHDDQVDTVSYGVRVAGEWSGQRYSANDFDPEAFAHENAGQRALDAVRVARPS